MSTSTKGEKCCGFSFISLMNFGKMDTKAESRRIEKKEISGEVENGVSFFCAFVTKLL
jgi:hypothetical protein